MLTRDEVVWAYRLFLDREPENDHVVLDHVTNSANTQELRRAFIDCDEYRKRAGDDHPRRPSPFWHYSSAFDAIGMINKYTPSQIQPSPAFATNFLGVKIRPDFYPHILAERVGTVEPPPIPANWHADIAEWASCLRAVDLSRDRFVMLELGCGWGCWINSLGAAAKSVGKTVKLYGIEADQESLRFARMAAQDNGLTDREFVLAEGVAGKAGGIVLFPRLGPEGGGGGVAIFNPDSQQLRDTGASGKYVRVPVVDIGALIKAEERLDFLHVDIQGAELDLLAEQFDLLCKKVRYVVIGTHSKQIEGGLFELFMSNNIWKLEMERAALFDLVEGRPVVHVDGVQAWRNSRFD